MEGGRDHGRPVDADAVVVELDLETRDAAGGLLHEPHGVGCGVLVGRRVVERDRECGRRLSEVHAIDRAPVFEDVAAEAGRVRLKRVVGTELAVEIMVGGDDPRLRNPERQLDRYIARAIVERIDAAVDRRRSSPQVVVAGSGVDERVGGERDRLVFGDAGDLCRGVPISRRADDRVCLAGGVNGDALGEIGEQIVEQCGSRVFIHHDAGACILRHAHDRVVRDPAERHRRRRDGATIGFAAEENAGRAALGQNVVCDHNARHESGRIRRGRIEHGTRSRGVRGPVTARVDADPVGLRV